MAQNQTHSNFYGCPCYPARMRKIHSKMKELEWSQQISNCKSMQIFYDAQGNLTLQSEVGYTLNSNSSKLLWLSLLTARIKKIQSKNEGARVVTTMLHYPSIFKMLKGS